MELRTVIAMSIIQINLFWACMLVGLFQLEAAGSSPPREPIDLPGMKPDGSVLLPNQWSLRPVGRQVPMGDFPVNIAIDSSGEFAAVLHCGFGTHEIIMVHIAEHRIVSRVELNQAFYGIAFDEAGERLYCSGAGDEVLHSFAFDNGYLSDHREIRVRPVKDQGVPCGLALMSDGRTAWVANVWGQQLTRVDLSTNAESEDYTLTDSSIDRSARQVVPPSDFDRDAAQKRDALDWMNYSDSDPFPYGVVVDEARQRVYVSQWAHSQVAVFGMREKRIVEVWPTQEHPCELLLSKNGNFLFVANANRNTVTVIDVRSGEVLETLDSSLRKNPLPGSTPNSLALSPDGGTLFVANACNNNVAVFDVSEPGKSRALGFIPVGWYPTSVRVTPGGRYLLVANGKGIIPRSNRHGPQLSRQMPPKSVREYIGGLLRGTLSVIKIPEEADNWIAQLKGYTKIAYRCTPSSQETRGLERADDNPIPLELGQTSPIRYVVYIIKENRTYDQVLGDMLEGNGDPQLCLFPEEVTPNHHSLAREFVLLDNFYAESEVSADGHEWSMGAYATDFVEKFWPMRYGHNEKGKFPFPAEARFQIAFPAGGYLWDRAAEAGVSYRSYGEFIFPSSDPDGPATTPVVALQDHFDPWFRPYDLDYLDIKRAERFISEFHRFEEESNMPRLQIVRISSDHTHGSSTGKRTPRAMVADNDLALGMIVEALSKSSLWPETAVFVVEDDAQNGPDHVDAHRTVALVLSPYTRRQTVDSTMYSTTSMLHTIELILGLKPMSQFDAAALPMYNTFTGSPDPTPYKARPANVDLDERNPPNAWGRELSDTMDFSKEDAADDIQLNRVVWHSVRGPDVPMPAPIRAASVFAHPEDGDDDD